MFLKLAVKRVNLAFLASSRDSLVVSMLIVVKTDDSDNLNGLQTIKAAWASRDCLIKDFLLYLTEHQGDDLCGTIICVKIGFS